MLIWYAIFHYGPMYGIQLAFKDFYIMKGIGESPWVGFKHFHYLFVMSPDFWKIMKNTVVISFYHILFGFPARSYWLCCLTKFGFRYSRRLLKRFRICLTFYRGSFSGAL